MGTVDTQNLRRRLLQEAFLKKKERNPRFTLRAFAVQLGLNSGTLSRLISNRQPISEKTFEKVKSAIMSEISLDEYNFVEIPNLELERFRLIAKWYHMAILELTQLQGFQPKPTWIAEVLGISTPEATDAVERLFRLGFLKTSETGQWLDAEADLTTLGTIDTHEALRNYQGEILDLAKAALNDTPAAERDCTTLTVGLNSADLKKVRDILTSARRRVNELSAETKKRNTVYQLSIAFFPVSKKPRKVSK